MLKLDQFLYDELTWQADGVFKRSYSLYHGDERLLQLRQDHGLFRSGASLYAGAEEPVFTFVPQGFWHKEVVVDSAEFAPDPPASVKFLVGGGCVIKLADGATYEWRKRNFWGREWLLYSADRIEIATLTRKTWSTGGTVTIVANVAKGAELTLLVALGWYAMILQMQQAAATAAAGA